MTAAWGPWAERRLELERLEARIAVEPDALEACLERALLLEALGDDAAAREAYLALLARAPTHFGALNNFGTLLYRTGYRSAARTAFAQAVRHHPDNAIGHANLAGFLLDDGRIDEARAHFERALALDPEHRQAHQSLAVLLLRLGDEVGARRHARVGFRTVTTWPYRGTAPPVPVLVLFSALGGNVPTEAYLDDRVFARSTVVAEFYDPAVELPEHRLVVNAIGDADRCALALRRARRALERIDAPVVNPPDAVLATGRAANAARCATLPDVVTPAIASFPRATLAAPSAEEALAARGLRFPLLVRAPGFHTGQHFVRVERPAELAGAIAALPGDELMALEYLDARGADGNARKYRVMIVDGRLYPVHLAIAESWKVHYFTSEMGERPEHRAEEARFLADMPGVIGARACAALARIRDVLGLDYAGIDFGLDREGRVLLFEANATMVVPEPDPDERWAYRRAPVESVHAAVRAMLLARAGLCAALA